MRYHPNREKVVAGVVGLLLPVSDIFIDVWKAMGRIRPIGGINIIWPMVVFGFSVALLLLTKVWKGSSWLSNAHVRRAREVLMWLSLAVVVGVGVSDVTHHIQLNRQRANCVALMEQEHAYLVEGSHGVREVQSHRFDKANDILKEYYRTDPVSAYYYAVSRFDGLEDGVSQTETTNAIRLMDSASSRQFYRAIFRMMDYYYRQGMEKQAAYYAEQLLRVAPQIVYDTADKIAQQQMNDLLYYSRVCYMTLLNHLMKEQQPLSELGKLNALYFRIVGSKMEKKTIAMKKSINECCYLQGIGQNEKALRKSRKLVLRYPGEAIPATNYYMFLRARCIQNDSIKYDMETKREIEQVLIHSLQAASKLSLDSQKETYAEEQMCSIASCLSFFYDEVGYPIEAAEMNHLAVGLQLRLMFKEYEKQNP